MTEPTRPVPGPPRPGPGPVPADPAAAAAAAGAAFADLDRRPVTEHVAVFEAEHARLQHELGTIDRL
ncbi:hypothetical protein SAMN06893096_1158 [Geodermatophilus pulveris]|uniref:Uncharacterized protein n=1 Tax=Geodermatophilus pulveris TaxID=1564159 RepID=A0A239JGT5_9ACTN|nr:hypothetical protein [Geodermatophilus pulveris]SNT05045.1 hypothetical protein SAMN06893096_1158 [Geodermatophilus pulveris]